MFGAFEKLHVNVVTCRRARGRRWPIKLTSIAAHLPQTTASFANHNFGLNFAV